MKKILLLLTILTSYLSHGSVTASFACSTARGCSPLVVDMIDHSTGTVTTWRWDFGNGNTSTLRAPSATYFNPGSYTVTLIVSDGVHMDSVAHTITVFSLPIVNLSSDRTTACPADSVHFIKQITAGSAPIRQYAWDFGNGVASQVPNVTYRYPQPGTYNVTLVVQDTNGCIGHLTRNALIHVNPKPTAAFTAVPQTSCATSQQVTFTNQSQGGTLSYQWKFGDSIISHAPAPGHMYTFGRYTPVLIATDQNGCIDSVRKKVAIINVQALFSSSKNQICVGESVSFFDLSPMPGTSWSWRFGDGSVSNKKNPKKVYARPGVYDVTFIVRDTICSDSATVHAFITVTSGFTVSFTASAQSSCTTPFTVHFASTASTSVTYSWDFGDGHTDSTANPTNTYTAANVYPVSLMAVDSSGCTVIMSQPGFINTAKPDVKFITYDTVVCWGTPIRFFNRTTNAVRYLWSFGDGTTSTQNTPTHLYTRFGHYSVSLTAWDSIGCDSTIVKNSYIHIDSARVDFAVSQRFSMCPPLVAAFTSTANRHDIKYFWDFGDGTTDTVANPTHIYFRPGIYAVRLIGLTKQGCGDTVSYPHIIEVQGPSGEFTLSPTSGCVPVQVHFAGTVSSNVSSVVCDMGDGTVFNDSTNFDYTYRTSRIFHPNFLVTDHVGCSVAYALDSISTHASPLIQLKDTSICAGQSVHVNLGTDHYTWSYSDDDKNGDTLRMAPLQTELSGDLTIIPSDTMVYTVTATNEYGCSTVGNFKISVDPLPEIGAQDTVRLCKNQTAALTLIQSAYRVQWSPAIYLNSSTAIRPDVTPATSQEYVVTAFNKLGCSVSGTVPVVVSAKVPVTLTHDTTVCPGSQVMLHVSSPDTAHAISYTWLPSANLKGDNTQNPMATMGTETETFCVLVNKLNCMADTAQVKIKVAPAASVSLPPTVVIAASAEMAITPSSSNLVVYIWTATDSLSCHECYNPVLFPLHSQYVYLHGENTYGCTTIDSMFVHVTDCDPSSIFVANVFTPNNDGVNDKLYMRSKALSQISYFRIFNRWGAIVFETSTITEGWDGTVNGKMAEQGVYVYQIEGKCHNGYEVVTSGTVTVLR